MNDPNSINTMPTRTRGRPRDWHDKTEQNTIKSLDRAMAVFEFLSQGSGKTLTTLASETNQSTATVYRILVTLEGRGLVEFDASAQTWHIGTNAFIIGARYLRRTSLVERARPIMRHLMERTGETANLGIEKSDMVLFLSQVETHESIRAFFPPGTLSPMHASGIGKALLAQMNNDRFERWYETQAPTAFTEQTLTEKPALQSALAEIREQGYALDEEERTLGMRCIAAPVFNLNQEAVAGISVSGPTSRMNRTALLDLADAVMTAARVDLRSGGESNPRSAVGVRLSRVPLFIKGLMRAILLALQTVLQRLQLLGR